MDIKGISNSMPSPGIRPAAEGVPVLQSAQNPGQVTARAVSSPSAAERAAAGKKAASSENLPVQGGKPEAVDMERVKKAMESIEKSLDSLARSSGLQFSIDDDLGRVVVKVVDPETKEILKQFPSEDAIALAKSLGKSNSLHQEKA